MTKREEVEQMDSTLARTADDEPIFILCGRDACAPLTVIDWIDRAHRAGVSQQKLSDAFRQAIAMLRFQAEHGSKLPD